MKLVWERVESTGIGYGSFFRAEVPGGFILLMDMLNDNGSNSVTMIFVPTVKQGNFPSHGVDLEVC
jgi:hypothetical protein